MNTKLKLKALSAVTFLLPTLSLQAQNTSQQCSSSGNCCCICVSIILGLSIAAILFAIIVNQKRHRTLLWLSLVSIALVFLLISAQEHKCEFLNLDPKWLILSCVPIVIGLFLGGYIKSFKWQGIELDINLDGFLDADLSVSIEKNFYECTDTDVQKQTLQVLQRDYKDEQIIASKNNLQFINGKRNYYKTMAIHEYLKFFPNMQYLVINDQRDRFQYILSVSCVKNDQNSYDDNKIDKFLEAIENKKIKDKFKDEVVTDYVSKTDTLKNAFFKMHNNSQSQRLSPTNKLLPLLDKKRKFICVIDKQKLSDEIIVNVFKNIN